MELQQRELETEDFLGTQLVVLQWVLVVASMRLVTTASKSRGGRVRLRLGDADCKEHTTMVLNSSSRTLILPHWYHTKGTQKPVGARGPSHG
jgi:hypothetical protein